MKQEEKTTNAQNSEEPEMLPVGSLNLKKEVVEILKDNGFFSFSDIQSQAIPKMLKGESVLGLALTGTGKTLAYLVPIINDLVDDGHVQAVILSPTVGLLDQIKSVCSMFLSALGFPEDSIKSIKGNNDFTRSKPDIILTTPSMYDSLRSHYPFNELKRVIIDEGDMVAFDGFADVLGALKSAKEKKIISFFSASLNIQDIKKVKNTFNISNIVDVRNSLITNKTVLHHLVNYRGNDKDAALSLFLKMKTDLLKSIVFVSRKADLFVLDEYLKDRKIKHFVLHGDMDKRDISKTLSDFNKADFAILLASDYASRGIDISDVHDIISVDLPKDLDYYFHRAGRAGRFNESGDSYVFYSEDDEDSIKKVKDLIRRGVSFDHYILSSDGLKKSKAKYQFKNLGKKDQSNELLQKQIRHAVELTKSNRVKPNYKKKVSREVEKVKEKHRMKVVLTNIARSGGNAADYHVDKNTYKGRKKTRGR
ncbi:MAG: DEAD/DEAH box helicase [Bacilli bacterium]